jgi:hypothetical protein
VSIFDFSTFFWILMFRIGRLLAGVFLDDGETAYEEGKIFAQQN